MTTETTLQFYPLTFVKDAPDVIIGRTDVNSYAAFPEDGANLLKQLQSGSNPETAARWYQENYGEPIDITDFVETLRDLQFLREGEEETKKTSSIMSARIWQLLGQAIFSPLAWIIYACLFAFCCYLMIHLPYLRPSYKDFFFSPYLVVIELGIFLGQFPAVFIHEGFHVLAGKRLGISSSLGIGRRLYIIVFETRLTGLWSVQRKKRYLPFLAGMLADVLLFSLLTILAGLTYIPGHPYALPGAFFLAMAFSTLLRLVWQFYFYLQTDIYYVFSNALHCVDLQKTTQSYLWNRFYRLIGRRDKMQDESEWHPNDSRVAPWYACFFGAGWLFTLSTLLLVGLPTAIRMLSTVFDRVILRGTIDTDFWDSLVFLLLNLIQVVIFLILTTRDIQRWRSGRRAEIAREEISA